MTYPREKQIELRELDRIMRVIGTLPCGLLVYLRTDEHTMAPHVHVCDVATRGGRFHTCVLLTEWSVFVHPWDEYPYAEGRRGLLSRIQERQLWKLFNARRGGSGETNWRYAVRCWNECGYASRIEDATPMPEFCEEMHDGAIGWMGGPWETTGFFSVGRLKFATYIRGADFEDGREPHFHLMLRARRWFPDDFNFEISLIDILAKDELNLLAMRDSRDPEREIVRCFKDECLWAGYEKIRDAVADHLRTVDPSPFRHTSKDGTNLAGIIRAWDYENNVSCASDSYCYGYRIADYMDRHNIEVLPKYAVLLEESRKRKKK